MHVACTPPPPSQLSQLSQASTEPDAEIEHVRGCVSSGSNSQCNTSSTLNTILCCNHSDYCNENLTAELGQTQGTPSLPTSQPDSEFTIAPILIPGIPDTTTASDSSSPSKCVHVEMCVFYRTRLQRVKYVGGCV